MNTRTLALLASLSIASPGVAAQGLIVSAPLGAHGVSPSVPHGLALGPDGMVYVAMGEFGAGNVVLRLEPAGLTVTGTIPTGAAPQEIAFAAPAGGAPVGVVTCGDFVSPKVTVFDVASGAPIATSVIGGCDAPPSYEGGLQCVAPAGVATRPDGKRAYVARGLSVISVDLDPASATLHQALPAESLGSWPADRLVVAGNDLVVAAGFTKNSPLFSIAYLERRPLAGGAPPLDLGMHFQWSVSGRRMRDVALAPSGIVYASGSGLSGRVFGFDPATGQLATSFHAGTSSPTQAGLAVSPDGRWLAVCDQAASELSFVDLTTGVPVAVVQTIGVGLFGPYDAAFSADGSSLYVSFPGSTSVARFATPPAPAAGAFGLGLAISSTVPAGGSSVSFSTSGAGANDLVVIFADPVFAPGAVLAPIGALHVGASAFAVAASFGADAAASVVVPPVFLSTPSVTCQAIALDLSTGAARASAPVPVVVQ